MVRRGIKSPWFVREPRALEILRSTLLEKYPTLHANEANGTIVVCGSLPVRDQGADLDWYLVEIVLPDDYPASPSSIRETGGRIPRVPDRHVNTDGTLCLAVPEELWIKWRGKFDIGNFIDGPVRTFLISNSLVEHGKEWPHGERSHGAAGVCEFYRDALGIGETDKVLKLLGYLSKKRTKGHWLCPCGSGRIIRHCHRDRILEMHATIPPHVIKYSLNIVMCEMRISP